MSLADSIAPHLPYLRRYARALTGSQESGDAYVGAALETIVASPEILTVAPNTRLGLYQVLSRIWNSLDVNIEARPQLLTGAERRIEAIAPRPRQAFLLTSVEGFAIDEAAAILGVDRTELERLVAVAGREIGEQMATDVLIIEDEPIIAMDLEALIEGLGHTVVGVARTHAEAVRLAVDKRPGLVLADIQLADGSSGLEAVNEILAGFEMPIVFITAYPERLLTGQRPEPAFLITKPFDEASVRAIASQALFFDKVARAPKAQQESTGTRPSSWR